MRTIALKPTSYAGWIVALLCLNACISKNGPDILTTSRVAQLLSLDTGKVWVRTALRINSDDVELQDCELQNRYSFGFINDADTAFYIGAPPDCAQLSSDTLERWSWRIVINIRGEFLDSLELTDENGEIVIRRIIELTGNNLRWEFVDGPDEKRETFNWLKDPE